MTSQPSTSNPPMYYDGYGGSNGEQMNMYPVDYQSNLICSMQYFNNTHNRFPVGPPQPTHYSIVQPHPSHHQMLLNPHMDDRFMFGVGPTPAQYSSLFHMPQTPQPPQPTTQPTTIQQSQPPVTVAPSTTVTTTTGSGGTDGHQTTAMDSCQHISHVLQCYHQGGEDGEFVRKAIESLVKKLKDKRIELDALITAVTSGGKTPSGCVTIQRSLDGRLQVAGRKGVPHVVYARIWRWPKVNKNELVKMVQCQTPIDHVDFICINPYHYERVVSNRITNLDSGLHVENLKKEFDYSDIIASTGTPTDFMDWPNSPNFPSQQLPHYQFTPVQQLKQLSVNNPFDDRSLAVDLTHIIVPPPQPLDYWCSIIYYELDTQIGETFKVSSVEHGKIIIDGGMDPHGENEGRLCLGALSNVHRTDASEKARTFIGGGVELVAHADGNVSITSKCKVFVRSGYLDYCQGVEYGSRAHRVQPGENSYTVFDIRWAYMQMLRRSESSNEAVRAQAAAVAGFAPLSAIPHVMPDSGVDRMRRDFCTVAISFVKSWGDELQRKTIKETPCWIEVTLHRPLQLLDQLLKNSSQIGNSPPSSFT